MSKLGRGFSDVAQSSAIAGAILNKTGASRASRLAGYFGVSLFSSSPPPSILPK